MKTKLGYCQRYTTLEDAQNACQCQCDSDTKQSHGHTFYECNYGNCAGYKCPICDKFEIVRISDFFLDEVSDAGN